MLSQKFLDVNDPQTVVANRVYSFDEFGNGSNLEISEYIPSNLFSANLIDPTEVPVTFSIEEINELALSDSQFSGLIADGHFKDVYGVEVSGIISGNTNFSRAVIHFDTRKYLNEDQSSYTSHHWQAEITPEDLDTNGNFNATFFAPQNELNAVGQFDKVHVGDALVVDAYSNSKKATLAEDLMISANFSLPEGYASDEDFPTGRVDLQATNNIKHNNLPPYPDTHDLHFDFRSSFNDTFIINFNNLINELVVDPNGDQLSIKNDEIYQMVYSPPDVDGSYSGSSQIYNGSSLDWIDDGILRVGFTDDVDLNHWGNAPFYVSMSLLDGSSTTDLSASITFMPNIHDVEVTDISIEDDKYLKIAMNQPVNFSELGDGSSSYSVHFEDIKLYTENTYFRFEGTGYWTGDGYLLVLPNWVPDGEFVFIPHHEIADLRGDNGVVSSKLNLVTPNSEIIKVSTDRPDSATDVSGPSILGIGQPFQSMCFAEPSGTIEDASAIEHVIFQVSSDYWDRAAALTEAVSIKTGAFHSNINLKMFRTLQ